ncbi:hypothetical protein OC835_000659 [Tilletia horrida]|uniref:Mitochondrial presequence protease n=1 Tax=Tilletia horrida TaxID=155126 RepID=A0AAN6JLW3_9BASI|nr:hypothetical protein OC842_001811 [Tilletia horrida]KAK0540403.1 hypothetical protein OC835_000659 [Tilletia horrida]
MSAPAASDTHGHFRLIKQLPLPFAPTFTIEKWVSDKTGLTLYWVNFDSPLLNLYVTLATEIFNDSGVPHTLEHLIFLGSEKYPYKGVLDSLANRAFAQGTNAWTANDHTAYTLTTAGSDGFLRMLPIYLDHVFFPTLTDSGFVTEVYHVTPQGTDSGVVYSEMQGRENSSGDLMELCTQRLLYPTSSAYRSETGGLMSALRVLGPQTIRDYHKSHYASHNAAVIICGPLKREALLSTLEEVEKNLIAHGQTHGPSGPAGWKRPFIETTSAVPPAIDGSAKPTPANIQEGEVDLGDKKRDPLRRKADVMFPEKDETMGEVQITWMGPALNNWLENDAFDTLGTYLTDSAVSTLQKAFVERDDPLCTDIYTGQNDRAGKTTVYMYFSSVPSSELDNLDVKLIDVLKDLAKEGFDMDRMRTVLERERLKLLSDLERRPADSLGDFVIRDFLYGQRDGSDLAPAVDDLTRIDSLLSWTAEQWADLLRRYLIENPRLVVVGKPSAALAKKLKADTRTRVEERKQKLGPDGLKKLKEELEAAQKQNDKDIPPEMLSGFPVPDPATIQWIPVGTGKNDPLRTGAVSKRTHESQLDTKVQAHLDTDKEILPFYCQFDHVSSNFVRVAASFSTASLPAELRPLLVLYLGAFFTLPVTRTKADGTKEELSYEDVVKLLDKDTTDYDIGLGDVTGFSEHIEICIKAEKSKYELAIGWLRDLLWNSTFSLERLRISASKILQSLPEQKRDGSRVSWALARSLLYDAERSSNVSIDLLTQITTVPELVETLNKDGEKVASGLAKIRETIFVPENLRVSVIGDILQLSQPKTSFKQHFCKPDWTPKEAERVQWSHDVLSPLGKQPSRSGLMCSLPTIESSYAIFSAKSIDRYDHPDLPAMTAALAVLNAMESYLWRYIRGAGLAYGASIQGDTRAGHIHFSLYRSPDCAKAFKAAKDVIDKLASGEMKIDETTLESAKSSVTLSIAESEGTVGQAAAQCFNNEAMQGTEKGRGRRLLQQLNGVTIAEVQRVLKEYIVPLFNPATSICAIASAPQQAKAIREALTAVGYEIEERTIDTAGDDGEEGSEGSDEQGSDDSDVEMTEDDSDGDGSRMSS